MDMANCDLTTLKVNVLDEYEGIEVIGKGVTLKEAAALMQERYEDTDGECLIHIYTFYGGYDVTHMAKFYNNMEY